MLLLRRLIQQGVVLKEELKPLGLALKSSRRDWDGVSDVGGVGVDYSSAGRLSGFTIALVLTLAVIYGFREIFKDDVRNAMWRFIQGRPMLEPDLRDTTSQAVIAKQLVWLEFMRQQDLPDKVSEILKHRHSQNKVDAEILHYKIATKVNQSEFQAGYSTIQEQVNF